MYKVTYYIKCWAARISWLGSLLKASQSFRHTTNLLSNVISISHFSEVEI